MCFSIYFQIITEKSANTTIHLLMQGARASDSGIYQCKPNNAPEAQIKVHILIGGMLFPYISACLHLCNTCCRKFITFLFCLLFATQLFFAMHSSLTCFPSC